MDLSLSVCVALVLAPSLDDAADRVFDCVCCVSF